MPASQAHLGPSSTATFPRASSGWRWEHRDATPSWLGCTALLSLKEPTANHRLVSRQPAFPASDKEKQLGLLRLGSHRERMKETASGSVLF